MKEWISLLESFCDSVVYFRVRTSVVNVTPLDVFKGSLGYIPAVFLAAREQAIYDRK